MMLSLLSLLNYRMWIRDCGVSLERVSKIVILGSHPLWTNPWRVKRYSNRSKILARKQILLSLRTSNQCLRTLSIQSIFHHWSSLRPKDYRRKCFQRLRALPHKSWPIIFIKLTILTISSLILKRMCQKNSEFIQLNHRGRGKFR